jgi:hypothetical protein
MRLHVLYACPECLHVDFWDDCRGFLEKGYRDGVEQATCPKCGEWVYPIGIDIHRDRVRKRMVVKVLMKQLHSRQLRGTDMERRIKCSRWWKRVANDPRNK